MADFFAWYALITLAGWLALPLVWRLWPGLPSRGYPYARPVGWLLWGFVYWWLGTLGLARPGAGGAWAAGGLLLGCAALVLARPRVRDRLRAWLRAHWALVGTTEVVFAVAFAGWALVRAAAPDIVGTEKPMELAFIQALLRSEAFPPHDPWLAGYAISYYYFGYLLTALLATLAGTPGPVAFNLAVALTFGLAASSAYGLGYDLLAPRLRPRPARGWALLTPLMVLVVSNWEGLLEVLHRRGVFWRGTTSSFWAWLDILNLNEPPTGTSWPPRFWWWWRASRVLHDTSLSGAHQEVIDEFPFFSFLLGDLHPHVLAIPFGMVALALALHLYRRGTGFARGRLGYPWPHLVFWAVVLGGLSFLNTWDFPLYVALAAAAWGLHVRHRGGHWRAAAQEAARWAVTVGLLGVGLYLPFYLGFGSQARGFLPNLLNPSRGAHLWVMFGPLWVPLALMLALAARRASWAALGRGFAAAAGVTVGLAALAWLMAGIMGLLPAGDAYLSLYAAADMATLAREALARQARAVAGPLTLLLLGGLAVGLLLAGRETRAQRGGARPQPEGFPLLLIAWGALLVQVPNFVYLWDHFGTRMNTVFKFYYQAWQLWAVAAAYAWVWLARQRWAWVLTGLAVAAGLVYPALALPERAAHFRPPQGWTLDGSAWLQRTNPDDWAAAQALARAPLGALAEAVGGSYSEYARLSTYSGQPAVVGWLGHEGQWRGGYAEVGTRPQDIERLYTTRNWETARAILERYGIRYVALGDLERRTYAAQPDLWERHLVVWWRQGTTTIYYWAPEVAPTR